MDMTTIEAALVREGLIPRGGFHPEPEDGVPGLGDGRPARTLVMAGNAGPDMWRAFAASPEFATAPDPLNTWSERVLGKLAAELGATALFPFGGPPHLPFVAWAKRAEPVTESPLGILIHPDYGLWHAYRGALAFAEVIDLPPRAERPRPCDTCADKPCLSGCPVGAFSMAGYDVPACADHLAAPAGADCMAEACRARRACPVGREYLYAPEQARFHMVHFLDARRSGSMKGIVILIDQPIGQRDDRASVYLAEKGYEVRWCSPGKGETLPAPGPEHAGVMVYGGAESANDDGEKPYLREELDFIEAWLATGKPFLGFCLGAQLLSRVLGGRVDPHPEGFYEIGYVPVTATPAADGFLDGVSHVYHWHHEGFTVPAGAELLAEGPVFPNQAFRYGANAYGLQFHPEIPIPVMTRWMSDADSQLAQPNAHPKERQLADAERYDAALEAWMRQFLDGWIDGG